MIVDFSYISDAHTRGMIKNGYTAVSILELNGWMSEFKPNKEEGFMWTTHPNIYRIMEKMESLPDAPGHSGSSFASTMRHLEFIFKKGIDEHKKLF